MRKKILTRAKSSNVPLWCVKFNYLVVAHTRLLSVFAVAFPECRALQRSRRTLLRYTCNLHYCCVQWRTLCIVLVYSPRLTDVHATHCYYFWPSKFRLIHHYLSPPLKKKKTNCRLSNVQNHRFVTSNTIIYASTNIQISLNVPRLNALNSTVLKTLLLW